MDNLPAELVLAILVSVRNHVGLGALSKCTRLNKKFHELSIPTLYSHVVLDKDTLGLLPYITNERLKLIRSITLHIDPILSASEVARLSTTEQGSDRSAASAALLGRLVRNLQQSVPRLSHCHNLRSFSCVIVDRFTDLYSVGIPRDLVAYLLVSLPQSVTDVEVRAGRNVVFRPYKRRRIDVCTAVRWILPRLRHVRLCLYALCGDMFAELEGKPGRLASIRTLAIQTTWEGRHAAKCNDLWARMFQPAPAMVMICQLLRRLVENGVFAERGVRLGVFDKQQRQRRDTPLDDTGTDMYRRYSPIENETLIMPSCDDWVLSNCWWARLPGRSDALGDQLALESAVEDSVWRDTTFGARLVGEEWQNGDVVLLPLGIIGKDDWRAAGKKPFQVCRYEDATGERVVECETRPLVEGAEEPPLLCNVPQGWKIANRRERRTTETT